MAMTTVGLLKNCGTRSISTSSVFGIAFENIRWPKRGVEVPNNSVMLDGDTHNRIRELAEKIAVEKDHAKFSKLIAELNGILDGCESPSRTHPDSSA